MTDRRGTEVTQTIRLQTIPSLQPLRPPPHSLFGSRQPSVDPLTMLLQLSFVQYKKKSSFLGSVNERLDGNRQYFVDRNLFIYLCILFI